MPMLQRVAAIDLGTNTARLLIADRHPDGSFEQVSLMRAIVRLGGGFCRQQGLADDAMQRTLTCLRSFRDEIDRLGVQTVRAVATSAVRDAVNGAAFVAQVERETGIRLRVIDGQAEGRITLQGVLAGLDQRPDNILLFDVGGGSTEYTLARGVTPCFVHSLPLGVVRLTEGKGEPGAMAEKINRELDALVAHLTAARLRVDSENTLLVGTAGTATTLAALSLKMAEYDYRKVNNLVLGKTEIQRIYDQLLPLSPAERLQLPGLEPGREDLIIAGALITLLTLQRFGFEQMKVSDYSLLEGLVVTNLLDV